MHNVFLGIGGNLGNKTENFKNVFKIIIREIGNITLTSSVYETPPWGFQAKESFWNQVLQVETELLPGEVLSKIHNIEDRFGRIRDNKNYTSREMDIDIIYYDDSFLENENLIIPHPLLHQRKFVLVPLAEIAPNLKHPLLRLTSLQMLENCKDESVIKKLDVNF
ncbi:MAG TPA: 2-amino-4-hydroxy-6-hydroxymethyldihydropteridine diphosphokinase [Prolixibacteraceae bacterium]|nr:2-amino-4-hydroxy-6-hydroxymethyldihydropteridine diphosphokinase [Prolixibacteraceae bacterium]